MANIVDMIYFVDVVNMVGMDLTAQFILITLTMFL